MFCSGLRSALDCVSCLKDQPPQKLLSVGYRLGGWGAGPSGFGHIAGHCDLCLSLGRTAQGTRVSCGPDRMSMCCGHTAVRYATSTKADGTAHLPTAPTTSVDLRGRSHSLRHAQNQKLFEARSIFQCCLRLAPQRYTTPTTTILQLGLYSSL